MKIKSITEAFSQQPNKWYVCAVTEDYVSYGVTKPHKHNDDCIVRIEKVQIDVYDWIYIAYDCHDRKVAEWQSKSVNVEYYY